MNYTIWITKQCNMSCDYCYEKKRLTTTKMDMVTAQAVAGYIEKNNLQRVRIHYHGGEVFTNLVVIDYLSERLNCNMIKTNLTTNGTILNSDVKRVLRRISDISVSIDGDRTVYTSNRHLGSDISFDQLVENIKNILYFFPHTSARMTVTPNNYKFLNQSISFLISIGFKRIHYSLDYYSKKWTKIGLQDLWKILNSITGLKHKYRDIQIDGIGDCVPHRLSACNGGTGRIDIYADGSIYPCTAVAGIEQFKIGDIWSGMDIKQEAYLQDIVGHEMKDNCIRCDYRSYCRGFRCRFVNYDMSGDLFCPGDTICELQKLIMEKYENSHIG